MKQNLFEFYNSSMQSPVCEFLTPCLEDDKRLSRVKQAFIKHYNAQKCIESVLNEDECQSLQASRQREGKPYLLSLTIEEALAFIGVAEVDDEFI